MSPDRLVECLAALVRARSDNPPGDERAIADVLRQRLAPIATTITDVVLTPRRPNLIARFGRCDGAKPTILLAASMDTVPVDREDWRHPPYAGVVVDGALWGRGSVDMKGGIAAAIEALTVRHNLDRAVCDAVLVLTADGELGSEAGMAALARTGQIPAADGAFVLAPTSMLPYRRERGVLWLHVDLHGRAAPANRPADGVSAIAAACDLIGALPARIAAAFYGEEGAGPATALAGRICGGERVNAFPARCAVEFDLRLPSGAPAPTADGLAALIAACVHSAVTTSTEILVHHAASATPRHSRLWQWARSLAPDPPGADWVEYPGPTDARFLRRDGGLPTVVCGPGDQRLAHGVDEHVSISQICRAAEVYVNLFMDGSWR